MVTGRLLPQPGRWPTGHSLLYCFWEPAPSLALGGPWAPEDSEEAQGWRYPDRSLGWATVEPGVRAGEMKYLGCMPVLSHNALDVVNVMEQFMSDKNRLYIAYM
jgi:hypothetical protein